MNLRLQIDGMRRSIKFVWGESVNKVQLPANVGNGEEEEGTGYVG